METLTFDLYSTLIKPATGNQRDRWIYVACLKSIPLKSVKDTLPQWNLAL